MASLMKDDPSTAKGAPIELLPFRSRYRSFTYRLPPLAIPAASRDPRRPIAPPLKTLGPQDFRTVEACATIRGITVATIEDDERMRQAMVHQIATAGLEGEAYACAEKFLNAANVKGFDCRFATPPCFLCASGSVKANGWLAIPPRSDRPLR